MGDYLKSSTYKIMLYLKLFKFFLIPRIYDFTKTLQSLIAKRFYMKRHLINNIFLWTRTLITLYLLIHLFACIIIYEREYYYNKDDKEWKTHEFEGDVERIDEKLMANLYCEMVYFVTTTLTTVGYGDDSALPDTISRLLMSVLQACGLLAFSLISNNVFSYESVASVTRQISERQESTKDFLNDLALSVKGKFLDEWIYNITLSSIATSFRLSTRYAFNENPFYKNLSPQLQKKLVKSTLYSTIDTMEFFLNDYKTDTMAPDTLVTELVTKLDMELWLPGENIIVPDQTIYYIRFIAKGSCILWGYDRDTEIDYKVCKLPEKSWFGDYNVFLSLKATFRLQAYKPIRKKNETDGADDGRVHMLTIKGDDFMEIINRYPEMRKFLLVRSVARRAHFRKMKQETKNIYEILMKEKMQ